MATYLLGDDWEKVASGSCSVLLEEGLNVWIYRGLSLPPPEYDYIVLSSGNRESKYIGSLNTYARRADNSAGVRTRITVTPEGNDCSYILESEEYLDLPANTTGSGFLQLDNNEAWVKLSWGHDGNLVLINKSDNVTEEQSAEDMIIIFGVNEGVDYKVRVKNAFHEQKTLNCNINYRSQ